jgi:hypothetical protein
MAVPCSGPFDTLYFVEGDWTEQLPEEEEDEDDEEEEESAAS